MTIERVKRDSERDQSEKKRDGKQVVERKRETEGGSRGVGDVSSSDGRVSHTQRD